jgi:calcineurin-like phosphoesterase family protein
MVFYVSDMCFGDEFIARKRHYSSAQVMSESIVSNWNSVVCNTDTVYILGGVGDFDFLRSLNGEKILILSEQEDKHMKEYVSCVSTNRDEEYDAEMYSWYLKSNYGVSNVIYSRKIIRKSYSGKIMRLTTQYTPIRDITFTIIGGMNNEYQRLFRCGLNSNIFMNGMYPISEVEVEELEKYIKNLI